MTTLLQWCDDHAELLRWPIIIVTVIATRAAIDAITPRLRACRLFGHHYARATRGFTAIDGQPVFRCTRGGCGTEWSPHHWINTTLTARDTFAPYAIADTAAPPSTT